jgi:glutamine synthetase
VETIPKYMQALGLKHETDVKFYGAYNHLRMTGKHETSSYSKFTWSVGGRHTSVRIPFTTSKGQTGYFEDRRTASNLDPYLACAKLADTILLSSEFETEMLQKAQKSGIHGFETA